MTMILTSLQKPFAIFKNPERLVLAVCHLK